MAVRCIFSRNILCKVVLAENRRNHKLDEYGVYTAVKNEVRTLHGDYATASLVNLSGAHNNVSIFSS